MQVRNIFMSTRFWIPPAPFQGLEIVGVADADNAARLKIAENYVIPSFATLDELLQQQATSGTCIGTMEWAGNQSIYGTLEGNSYMIKNLYQSSK